MKVGHAINIPDLGVSRGFGKMTAALPTPSTPINHEHPFSLAHMIFGPGVGLAVIMGFGVLPFRL